MRSCRRDHDGQHHHDDRSRDRRHEPLESIDAQHRPEREGEGRAVGLRDGPQGAPDLLEPVARRLGHAEHRRDLPREHLNTDAGKEADEHGSAEEVADEAHPQQPGKEEHHRAHERDQARPGHPPGAERLQARDAQPPQAGGENRGRGGVGADHQQRDDPMSPNTRAGKMIV